MIARHVGLLALLAILGASLTVAPAARAQVLAHREVPRGEVTGLEMAIDGSLTVVPGGRLRWWTTLFEVVNRRDLRPSAGSTLRALATFSRGEPVATATTDANGRAALEIQIPSDLEDGLHFIVEATSPRGVRRLFDVNVSLAPRYELSLFADRPTVRPGGSVLVIGRVIDHATDAPAADQEVVLRATQAGPLGPPRTLRTDRAGIFVDRFRVMDGPGPLMVTATSEEGASGSVSVALGEPVAPRFVVSAIPASRVVAPGALVALAVEVRTPDGAPVAGAVLDGPARVPPAHDEELAPIRTDADGRATYPWKLPESPGEAPLLDVSTVMRVTAIGLGSIETHVSVRTTRQASYAALAVEGGALVPELRARLYARVVAPDGSPLAGREVELDAPLLGGTSRATSDASGIAVFDIERVGTAAGDECGGPTATEVVVRVDGAETASCVRVDPDAPIAVRAVPSIEPGGTLRVEIARRSVVARAPIVVTLLRTTPEGLRPIAEALAPSGAASATLEIPPEVRGDVVVRARPLLAAGQAVRGASTLVSVQRPPASVALRADEHGAGLETGLELSTIIVAAEESSARALEDVLRGALLGDARSIEDADSASALAASLATRVPDDVAATAVLREGEIVPQAMPSEPVRFGMLRDPWRTRARFVRGRIGRLMRAVEDHVDAHVSTSLDEVAVRGPRGWSFNREMLASALESAGIGDEGAAALDGEPLDIAALGALDPSFTYDAVARRITRRRLWRLLVVIHAMVRERELELPWARRGDPSTWIASLPELSVGMNDYDSTVDRDALFDGWGNALVLRPARGRARFDFLPPLSGWELVSVGPDGREGTRDDIVDPFARALPSGSLYADAVGEDALIARVSGVALGRATLGVLADALAIDSSGEWSEETAEDALARAWTSLPMPLPELEVQRSWSRPTRDALGGATSEDGTVTWTLSPEGRRYGALAIGFAADGRVALASTTFEGGAPFVVSAELPSVLRPGERVRVPVDVTVLRELAASREGAPLAMSATTRGAGVVASLPPSAPTGGAVTRSWLELSADRVGATTVTITVVEGDDRISVERTIRVLPEGSLRGRAGSTLVRGEGELAHELGDDALPVRATVVLSAPRTLTRSALLEDAPAAVGAWSRALSDSPSEELLATLERAIVAGELGGGIERACALIALGASEPHARLVPALGREALGAVSSDLRERGAMLVALATAAPGLPAGGSSDAVASLVATLRQDGWRALATERDSPTVMARTAAALLLIDREDGPGRALLHAATDALTRDELGLRRLEGDAERPGDGWIGTLALAIAARQIGDDALADELASAAARSMHLARRLGAEGAFWAAAASTFGALGGEGPASVRVAIDGAEREVALENGVASLDTAAGARIRVRSDAPVLAMLATRLLRRAGETHDATLTASIEGETGRALERSALELVIEQRAGDASAARPFVEVTLPGAALFDDVARTALLRSPSVLGVVGPDAAGVVRIELAPLRGGSAHRVPLVLRWLGDGRTIGLGLATYDGVSPGAISTAPPRTIELARASEEAR